MKNVDDGCTTPHKPLKPYFESVKLEHLTRVAKLEIANFKFSQLEALQIEYHFYIIKILYRCIVLYAHVKYNEDKSKVIWNI